MEKKKRSCLGFPVSGGISLWLSVKNVWHKSLWNPCKSHFLHLLFSFRFFCLYNIFFFCNVPPSICKVLSTLKKSSLLSFTKTCQILPPVYSRLGQKEFKLSADSSADHKLFLLRPILTFASPRYIWKLLQEILDCEMSKGKRWPAFLRTIFDGWGLGFPFGQMSIANFSKAIFLRINFHSIFKTEIQLNV